MTSFHPRHLHLSYIAPGLYLLVASLLPLDELPYVDGGAGGVFDQKRVLFQVERGFPTLQQMQTMMDSAGRYECS